MSQDHSDHNSKAEQEIIDDVEQFGCSIALFEADNYLPAFAYSIGLYKNFGHPEIICFGLQINVMTNLINDIRDMVKAGETVVPAKPYAEVIDNYDVQFVQVDKAFYPNYLGYASWFYGYSHDYPVLQLVWPDKQQLFPWDEAFNPAWKFKQPLLDRDTGFKFYEEKNLGVYTTKQAFEGEPILYVYHNEDGDWQFHTSDHPDITDSLLVSLEEITKLDPSINEIYHLQYGWSAWRSSIDENWQYAESEDEQDED